MNWMAQAAGESVKTFFTRLGSFLPTLIGVIVILLVGWIVAGLLQKLLEQVLKAARVDELAHKVRVNEILQKGDIRYSLSELIGLFLYWLVILATLLAALNALGLTIAAELLERVLAYVPNVLAGVIVLILGLFFATLVGGIVQTASANAGVSQAKGLGQIARVVVIVFASVVALEKFFSSVIIQTTFTVVVAAICFGLALAFGLGCKDIAGKYVSDFIDKIRRR
ncbi:MAG: hypothetical protein HYZ93_03025 [Candidatus Omnitrophica bacterium]|nr:hypothetical protein [Candidatus Omnitrophota bacterium]